jgi:UDP-N-acetylglucosamine--N-acetylmuramyl-(pentapeptide) pyrophosphoryl-undecaprenol N-acetylglucosamine transferase
VHVVEQQPVGAPIALHGAAGDGSTTTRPEIARVAIACGWTGGHVYPALAVADAWRHAAPGVELILLGSAGGFEARLVPAHGYRLALIHAAPFAGVGLGAKMRALWATAVGTLEARSILRAERVELVLGFGGYVAAPAVLAAWSLGVPTVLHEANAVAGVANRTLARLADRVLLGFETPGDTLADDAAVTGMPIRAAIAALAAQTRQPPAAGAPIRVLVTGGSHGSRFLDERVPDLLTRVAARGLRVEARHQVGNGDLERTRAHYAAAAIPATVVAYLDDMAAAYAWADVAIVSAGAGTLAELAAAGLPAVVVPLASAAGDHQSANARVFAAATGASWTREETWDADERAAWLVSLVTSSEAWRAASAGVRRLARADAAAAVLRVCNAILSARACDGNRAPGYPPPSRPR